MIGSNTPSKPIIDGHDRDQVPIERQKSSQQIGIQAPDSSRRKPKRPIKRADQKKKNPENWGGKNQKLEEDLSKIKPPSFEDGDEEKPIYNREYLDYLRNEFSRILGIEAPVICENKGEVYAPSLKKCIKISELINELIPNSDNLEERINRSGEIRRQYDSEIESILDSNIQLALYYNKIKDSRAPDWLKSKLQEFRDSLIKNINFQITQQKEFLEQRKRIISNSDGTERSLGRKSKQIFNELFENISIAEETLMQVNERKIRLLEGKFDSLGGFYEVLKDKAIKLLNNPESDGGEQIKQIQKLIEQYEIVRRTLKGFYDNYRNLDPNQPRNRSQVNKFFKPIQDKYKKNHDIEEACNSLENEELVLCRRYLEELIKYDPIADRLKEIKDTEFNTSKSSNQEELVDDELARLFEEETNIRTRLREFREEIMETLRLNKDAVKEKLKKIIEERDEQEIKSRENLVNLCKKAFPGDDNKLFVGCLTYLGEIKNLREIDERRDLIDAIPENSNVSLREGRLPANSNLHGIISDFKYFYFTNPGDFSSFIKNSLKTFEVDVKGIHRIEALKNKIIKLINSPEEIARSYAGKRSYKSVLAEYLAALDFISNNRNSKIIFPYNPNQAYFDFISYDEDGNTRVFPVKIGNENQSDPGREADTSGLLRLVGELPKRNEKESEEQYQKRLKNELEYLLSPESGDNKLKELLKNSSLCTVTEKGGVIISQDITIVPSEELKGTRTDKQGQTEIKHKYRILSSSSDKGDSFSSSIQKAIQLLNPDSKNFSEAGFKKFMRENKIWQAI